MNHYLIVYDIPDDRRRTRLHKLLQGYGVALQYSLFHVQADDVQLLELRRAVCETVTKDDSVIVAHLCRRCAGSVEQWGGGGDPIKEAGPIFV